MSQRMGRDPSLDLEISALIDAELDTTREAELRRRLDAEPELAARLAELEGVDAALRALPAREVPDGLGERLRQRLEVRASAVPRVRVPRRPWRRAATRAALALAAAAAIVLAWIGTRRAEDAAPWKSASDEDLEIALDMQVLDDLDVLEHLDLLEMLQEMDEPGRT